MKYELERWLLDKMKEEKKSEEFAMINFIIGTNMNVSISYFLKDVKDNGYNLRVSDIKSIMIIADNNIPYEVKPEDYKEFLDRMTKKEKI